MEYLEDEGSAAVDRSDGVAAETWFREALVREPDRLTSQRGLGIALALQGRAEDALPWLRRALARDPSDADLRRLVDAGGQFR